MSVRRATTNRWILFRDCGICGKRIRTTADTPFVRSIKNASTGGVQKTIYFCSDKCKASSYIHKWDGKAAERRAERESKRDISAKNRRYYESHHEAECDRQRKAYHENRDERLLDLAYQRRKRAIMRGENNAN
ncbi:MAG: hypothetical protein LBN00_06485 [Oscillospiraceae bacterium]|jgi:hypothetical protein|nr:hypothetical protein [Oscillospiraceae bacterium]